jgi:hypothetical protein
MNIAKSIARGVHLLGVCMAGSALLVSSAWAGLSGLTPVSTADSSKPDSVFTGGFLDSLVGPRGFATIPLSKLPTATFDSFEPSDATCALGCVTLPIAPLCIDLMGVSEGSGVTQRVRGSAPEPSTYLAGLGGMALLGLFFIRQRK